MKKNLNYLYRNKMNYDKFIEKYKKNIDYIFDITNLYIKKKKILYGDNDAFNDNMIHYLYNTTTDTIKNNNYNNIIGNIDKYDYYKMDNIGYFEDLHYNIKQYINDDNFMKYSNASEFAMIILNWTYILEKEDSDSELEDNYVADFF